MPGNYIEDKRRNDRIAANRCTVPDCTIPYEGHPRCAECGILVGEAHVVKKLTDGLCNLCQAERNRLDKESVRPKLSRPLVGTTERQVITERVGVI